MLILKQNILKTMITLRLCNQKFENCQESVNKELYLQKVVFKSQLLIEFMYYYIAIYILSTFLLTHSIVSYHYLQEKMEVQINHTNSKRLNMDANPGNYTILT